ncbi:troponin I-like [Tropilaelaps mercedesae]|uniref:Troponin I-like n=1 Tax=Tropilaelaps mercedesae TaxID=418985 RepID=A0A1V9X2Z1_9ACAR|nr:troponin I-like [Tropilaelaps mercedesae]
MRFFLHGVTIFSAVITFSNMPEMTEEEKRKMEEKERKKAEVRRRLEEASKAKKGGGEKKGFMTPERKKKLRALLRKKAAEELKKEQERKAEARKKVIAERCGQPRNVEGANEAALQTTLREYHRRIIDLEGQKYDLEYEVRQKDFLINELTIQVNDLRGKFVKPSLKKVSKFDKMKIKNVKTDIDFRSNLKTVKKDFKLDVEGKEPVEKPEWALGGKKEGAAEAEE